MATATLATNRSWNDKQSGETKTATEWHRLVFFGKLAEIAGQYLHKGSKIYTEGSLRTRKYTDNVGAERYITEIVVDEMSMLGKSPHVGSNIEKTGTRMNVANPFSSLGGSTATTTKSDNDVHEETAVPVFVDDDIPF